ncbi:MAG: hypothetical protein O2897_00390, partial [bacterium]|nr:hypothetical protein [bacterium]
MIKINSLFLLVLSLFILVSTSVIAQEIASDVSSTLEIDKQLAVREYLKSNIMNPITIVDAARENDMVTLEILLDDADSLLSQIKYAINHPINEKDVSGNAPIHYAVKYKNKIMMDMLLEYGADITLIDSNNKIPYQLATERNQTEFSNVLGALMADILVQQTQDSEWRWNLAKG